MYRRFRSGHTLSGCPRAERPDLVYGFSVEPASRQVGTSVPLSPSPGLSQRAETTLLNKFVEISATTGRFCSRRRLFQFPGRASPPAGIKISQAAPFFPEKKMRTRRQAQSSAPGDGMRGLRVDFIPGSAQAAVRTGPVLL